MNWLYPLALIALFYIVFRKHLKWESPMVIVRSNRFTQELYDFGLSHQWVLRGFFTIGVVLGLLLMAYSFWYLIEGVLKLGEETIPRLSMILPGQSYAGITFPLSQWAIAIAIAFIVHEGGHAIASSAQRIKPKNVRRDPRVALDVISAEDPYRMATVRGRVVEITTDGADDHIDKLAKKYLGQDKYPFRSPGEQRLILKIEPERVTAWPSA